MSLLGENDAVPDILVQLSEKLESAAFYSPLDVDDFLPPVTKTVRLGAIRALALKFPAKVFWLKHGGSVRSQAFVWRLDPDQDEKDQQIGDSAAMEGLMADKVKVFKSRAQRRDFMDQMMLLSGGELSKAKARLAFQLATGDASAAENGTSAAVDERLRAALLSDDPVSLLDEADLRSLNGALGQTAFDDFWDFLGEFAVVAVSSCVLSCTCSTPCFSAGNQITAGMTAAEERRKNDVLVLSPVAPSLLQLYLNTKDKFLRVKPGGNVPSYELTRLQFCPKDSYSETASRFTQRFPLRYVVSCLALLWMAAHHAAITACVVA